jgi:hypothetical protein
MTRCGEARQGMIRTLARGFPQAHQAGLAPSRTSNFASVHRSTVLVVDVLPVRPGSDLEVAGPEVRVQVRCSHHGQAPVRGTLHWAWQPHLAAASDPAVAEAPGGDPLPLSAAPFVLSEPAQVTTALPPGWTDGRLRLWLRGETAVLAATSLDVVRRATGGGEARG